MWWNYISLTIRNIRRQPTFSFINITGLVIGITSCMLIVLYVLDELRYDKFHANANQIYRIIEERRLTAIPRQFATSYAPISDLLNREMPHIKTVRLYPSPKVTLSSDAGVESWDKGLFYADKSIFSVFNFKLVAGNSKTALDSPFTMLISERVAEKYFGKHNPLGRTIKLNGKFNFKVTGILKNLPHHSHIQFDFLASSSTIARELSSQDAWWSPALYTYILLPKNSDVKSVSDSISNLIKQHTREIYFKKRIFSLQALNDIHLRSHLELELQPNSDIRYVYLFSVVAIFILIIACLNFMNLTVAGSLRRIKEVTVRRVAGANRQQLIMQFLTESVVMCLIAFLLALTLLEIVLPYFNLLIDKNIELIYPQILVLGFGFLIFVLITGVISGIYPAFYLSQYRPIDVIKGLRVKMSSGIGVRKALVIIQFAITIAMMISTIVVLEQINFIKTKDLGFKKEGVIVVPLEGSSLILKHDSIKRVLLTNPMIKSVSFSAGLPGRPPEFEFPYRIQSTPETGVLPNILVFPVDIDFIKTFQLKVIEGRDFNSPNDLRHAFILNEAAMRAFKMTSAVGQEFTLTQYNGHDMEVKQGEIIGVVGDFHYTSLHNAIRPIVIEISPTPFFYQYMAVSLQTDSIDQATDYIKSVWNQSSPNQPFDCYKLEDILTTLYRGEQRVGLLINLFSLLAIAIACLGLFGLGSYISRQRTQEIGIRKVLGADIMTVFRLLSSQFANWVLAANLLAWPPAFYYLNNWLGSFAYSVDISVLQFLAASAFTLFLAMVTIAYQCFKVAITNPAEALKYE